ncbi:unnamed protein product [Allacma fusca]|uniref:protein-serine/threonine phosphatase n=1 Tax=Allacma fusca TaxID=39272 RepID=A0A8J2PYR6_9HEXA|nr:unnamed protein product [Allacma fusca]
MDSEGLLQMGAYLSKPITKKETEEGVGNRLEYGASSMQGWRVSQEDAHNCVTDLDKNSSLFAVYDGHGGAEVAIYLARHFPEFFKKTESYVRGDWKEALHEAYVKIDAQIKSPETISEIQKIAKKDAGEDDGNIADYEEENVGELYEEATMPIEALMAKYTGVVAAVAARAAGIAANIDGERPGSSKSLPQAAATSSSASSSSSSRIQSSEGGTSAEVDEPMSSTSTGLDFSDDKSSIEPECSSSSKVSSESSLPKLEDTAEAERADGADDSPTGAIYQNESSNSVDGEPTSSTNEADCDSRPSRAPLLVPVNGINESVEPDSTEGEASGVSELLSVNGNSEVKVNGEAEAVADSTQSENIVKISIESPKRKGKVHPPPTLSPVKPTRSSPRRKLNDAKVYKDFINEESASSDSDDDANVRPFVNDSDSEDEGENLADAGNSSSSDEDEDVEEEEEEEDDDEDEEEEVENRVINEMQEPGYDSGSTAVVAFLQWNDTMDKLNLWVANAGDSRCVVSRGGKALEMSHDHKPEDEIEARRIINAGGKVTQDGRVNGGLNLSRALGDHSYKQNCLIPPEEQMITPVPDIRHEVLDPSTDQFFVLACDGVWNSMSSQEVVDFITTLLNKNVKVPKICEELFDACLAQDTSGDGTGCDNMTAIIVKLPQSHLKEEHQVQPVAEPSDQTKRRLSTSEAEVEESKRLKTESD